MPLDGLSSSNTGMYRFINPTENILQSEAIARQQSEEVVKKTEKSDKSKNDTDKDSEDQKRDLQGRSQSDDEEYVDESSDFVHDGENIKKYKVNFNKSTEMIEFIDKNSGSIVETITPDDLLNIMSKGSNSSGVLIDREI